MLLEELKNKENNKDTNITLLNKNDSNNVVNNKNDNSKNLEKYKANNKNHQEYSDSDLWYLCDECQYAIMPLSYVFECNTCDNYTLCKKCFKKGKHEHTLKKILVPIYCEPPANYENNNILSFDNNNNNENSQNNINGKTKEWGKKQNHEIEYLENDSSGYEDLIDDMPIRYKYIKVKPKAFNLTTDFILKTDDTKLDEIVPMKKISPYYQNKKK